MEKKHCCRACEPDSGYDIEMIKLEEERRKKIIIFKYKNIVSDSTALMLKENNWSAVFDYSGVPQKYLNCLDKHKIKWLKEKKGLSNIAVAEEGIDLVFKWFRKEGKRFELKGKSALVIGSEGRIGKRLCKILKGFGCHVLDYDVVFRKRRHLDFWLGFAELIFICTPEIKGFLLDEREFKLMKNRPLVVNVSGRVSLVNEKVLHDFISRGWVRGYACDEKSEEHKHCFSQKHQGAKSIEAIERREKELEKNIKTLIDRHKFINNNSPV